MEKAEDMLVGEDARPLDYKQLNTGMEALALHDTCCRHSLLAMGGMTAFSFRSGTISQTELDLLARRLHAIRQEKQCRCGQPGQPALCVMSQPFNRH